MASLAANFARWSHVLRGVLTKLGDVSVGGEECSCGRSAATTPRVDVRPVPLFHAELRESPHDGVPTTSSFKRKQKSHRVGDT